MDKLNKDALNKFIETNENPNVKNYSKLLAPINSDYKLADYLNMLTKPELIEIAKRLDAKGTSSLNKAQIIELLNTEIKNKLPDILQKVTEKEFYFILFLNFKEGITLVNLEEEKQRKMVLKLRKWGIVFSGTLGELGTFAVIPKDIHPEIKSHIDDEKIALNISEKQKWIRATSGLLYYYGVMEGSNLYEIVKPIMDTETDFNEYISAIDENCKYGEIIIKHDNLYCYNKVLDPVYIHEEQLKRESVPYKPIELKEAFQAGMEEFSSWTEFDGNFFNFVVNYYGVPSKQAENIVNDCIYLIKNGYDAKNIIEVFGKMAGIEDDFDLQSSRRYIEDMCSNTNLWVLKGNTFNSIYKDIGRNDACPCGSGKKFKKCCGKED